MHDDSRTPRHPDDTPEFDRWIHEAIRPDSPPLSREERELIAEIASARLVFKCARHGLPPWDAFRAACAITAAICNTPENRAILRNRIALDDDQ